jgi:hypothetical protein
MKWSGADEETLYTAKKVGDDVVVQGIHGTTTTLIDYDYTTKEKIASTMKFFENSRCISFTISCGANVKQVEFMDLVIDISTTFTPSSPSQGAL